jgi:hypothetical protein
LPKTQRWVIIVPTVLRVGGFAFRIYVNDHQPPHVHVYNADGWCRMYIASGAVSKNAGMRPWDVLQAARIVAANEKLLTRRWEEIHGQP